MCNQVCLMKHEDLMKHEVLWKKTGSGNLLKHRHVCIERSRKLIWEESR